MINKILSWFGLMKISRAKNISGRMHLEYVECVLHGIEKDFGVTEEPNYRQESIKTWFENFDKCVSVNTDDVFLIGGRFKEHQNA